MEREKPYHEAKKVEANMTNFDLKKHIQTYRTEIKIAGQNHEYKKVQLKLEESRVEIKKLDHSFLKKK